MDDQLPDLSEELEEPLLLRSEDERCRLERVGGRMPRRVDRPQQHVGDDPDKQPGERPTDVPERPAARPRLLWAVVGDALEADRHAAEHPEPSCVHRQTAKLVRQQRVPDELCLEIEARERHEPEQDRNVVREQSPSHPDGSLHCGIVRSSTRRRAARVMRRRVRHRDREYGPSRTALRLCQTLGYAASGAATSRAGSSLPNGVHSR